MTPDIPLADLQAQLECVTREVNRRARAYHKDRDGLSAQAAAALIYDLSTMQGVARTLHALIDARQLSLFDPPMSRQG
jgi:hypothetical protein